MQIRGTFAAVLLFMLVLCGAWSCHGKAPATQAIQYPAGWPVPALTVPPGGVQCHKPLPTSTGQGAWFVSGKDYNSGTPAHSRMWELYFTYSGTWQQAVAYTDSCLAHAGWRYHDHDVSDSNGYVVGDRFYISPDYLKYARIMLMDGTYYLFISTHDNEISQYPIATESQPLP